MPKLWKKHREFIIPIQMMIPLIVFSSSSTLSMRIDHVKGLILMAGTSSISELWILVFFIIGTQYSLFCIEDLSFLCNMRRKARGWLSGYVVETIIGDSQSCRKVRDEK
jgi:hypothetical protein